MKQVKPEVAVSAITQVSKALANTEPVNNAYSLNGDEIAGIKDWARLSEDQRTASSFLVDLLYANGKKPHHFVPLTEKDDKQGIAFQKQVCAFIVEGYTVSKGKAKDHLVKLYNADPKTLSTDQQIEQTVLRRKVGKDYNNLKGALKTRIAKGDQVGKKPAASQLVMALREVKSAIGRLEKLDEGYTNMASDIKALKALNILTCVKDSK